MYHPIISLIMNKQESYLITIEELSFTMSFSPASFTLSFFFCPNYRYNYLTAFCYGFIHKVVHLLLLQRIFLGFWMNNSRHLALLSRSACRLQDGPPAAGVCSDLQIHSRLPACVANGGFAQRLRHADQGSRDRCLGVLESPGLGRENVGHVKPNLWVRLLFQSVISLIGWMPLNYLQLNH